jgi:hypothetical protein
MAAKPHRIGRHTTDQSWLLKEPPSWRVVCRSADLRELHDYCTRAGIDPATVQVVSQWPRRSLAEHIAEQTSMKNVTEHRT